MPRIAELLRQQGQEDVVVFGGGIIPDADVAKLAKLGVERIFTPGTTMSEIVAWLRARVRPRV
jgi:methylmalonyl-CoA mutase C-terminal domain/subunit